MRLFKCKRSGTRDWEVTLRPRPGGMGGSAILSENGVSELVNVGAACDDNLTAGAKGDTE